MFIYVISSPCGLVKVGITSDPWKRLRYLQYRSEVPGRTLFNLEHSELVEAPWAVELTAHRLLRSFHHHDEWFETNVRIAVKAIKRAIEIVRNDRAKITS